MEKFSDSPSSNSSSDEVRQNKCDTAPPPNSTSDCTDIQVFYPTYEEFKDFYRYIQYVESKGAHHAGICKIVPPKEYRPRKSGYNNLDNMPICGAVRQTFSGTDGLYMTSLKKLQPTTVGGLKKFCQRNRTPSYNTDAELERIYWSNITNSSPIYGADIDGSITDEDCNVWNCTRLPSILTNKGVLATTEGDQIDISGVNTAYLYFGTWGATFAWHTEDCELYSINYIHCGAAKQWYSVPPAFARRFEEFAREAYRSEYDECPAFLRHKVFPMSPNIIASAGIQVNSVVQRAGEIILTFPYGYHSGFNQGFNIAESTNFATERWIDYGKHCLICHCRPDMVKIHMDPFVQRYQPEQWPQWRDRAVGQKCLGPHPLDRDYPPGVRNDAQQKRVPLRKMKLILEEEDGEESPMEDSKLSRVPLTAPQVLRQAPIMQKRPAEVPPPLSMPPKKVKSDSEDSHTTEEGSRPRRTLKKPKKYNDFLDINEMRDSEKERQRESVECTNSYISGRGIEGSNPPDLTGSETCRRSIPPLFAHSDNKMTADEACTPSKLPDGGVSKDATHCGTEQEPIVISDDEEDVSNETPAQPKRKPGRPFKSGTMKRDKSNSMKSSEQTPSQVVKSHIVPSHLEAFSYLWSPSGSYELSLERRLHHEMGLHAPHCVVCSVYWSPRMVARVLGNLATGSTSNPLQELPDQSDVIIPELIYCKGNLVQEAFTIPREKTSLLLRCAECWLTVHARCYGMDEAEAASHQLQGGWRCERCHKRKFNMTCIACPIRGGVLRSLVKSAEKTPGGATNSTVSLFQRTSSRWMHATCALGLYDVRFACTSRRVALVPEPPTSTATQQGRDSPAVDVKFCSLCSMRAPDHLVPLAECSMGKCLKPVHLMCALWAGWLLEYDNHPWEMRITCPEHPRHFYKVFDSSETRQRVLRPGQRVWARDPNNRRYYQASLIKCLQPPMVKIRFVDGTFCEENPVESVAAVRREREETSSPHAKNRVPREYYLLPSVGTEVTVMWTDGKLHEGAFLGLTEDSWEVLLVTGTQTELPRSDIFPVDEPLPPHVVRNLVRQDSAVK